MIIMNRPPVGSTTIRVRPWTLVRGLVVVLMLTGHLLLTAGALAVAAFGGRRRLASTAQRRARALVVALGASYIKGAQLLSTRRDVLPSGWCDVLGQLHDRVPPMPVRTARRALRSAYPAAEITTDAIGWDSVASGSIACVYRATLPDGRAVAVKIRRHGVAGRIQDDFALLRVGARVMQHLPRMRRLPAVAMMTQIGEAVAQQADFELEREALHALRANLADVDYLRIPEPVDALCRPGVLVMEYIPNLRRLAPEDETPELAERVLHCVYRMLFLDGLVHCDMHPGNLYLMPEGKIVLLDAGFVVRLEPKVQGLFAEFFLAMAHGDGNRATDVVRRSAAQIAEDADLATFRAEMVELIADSSGKQSAEFSLVRFASRLFDLQRRHGLFVAPEFVFPLLALLVLEGRIKELDSETDFQYTAMPVLAKALQAGYMQV
ncbi:MAG TPA: AarF/UbiB family protein [Pseudonocardiaceae bacterium]|nr:AarF/UbiB family protein [Pseudonocardiaceae bacterium]